MYCYCEFPNSVISKTSCNKPFQPTTHLIMILPIVVRSCSTKSIDSRKLHSFWCFLHMQFRRKSFSSAVMFSVEMLNALFNRSIKRFSKFFSAGSLASLFSTCLKTRPPKSTQVRNETSRQRMDRHCILPSNTFYIFCTMILIIC